MFHSLFAQVLLLMVSCATFTRQWLSSIVDCKVWWMAACKSQRLTFTRRHLSLMCQLPEKWISCKSSCIFGFKLVLLTKKALVVWWENLSVNISDKVKRRMQMFSKLTDQLWFGLCWRWSDGDASNMNMNIPQNRRSPAPLVVCNRRALSLEVVVR